MTSDKNAPTFTPVHRTVNDAVVLFSKEFAMAKQRPKMYTTDQIANRYGISRQRVWQLARTRHIEPEMIGKRFAMWTAKDMVALQPTSFTISEKAGR